MRAASLVAILWFCAAFTAFAQTCPKQNPNGPAIETPSQTFTGRIVYHDSLRQWFGLQLDAPVCGLTEFQLITAEPGDPTIPSLETTRGCRASVTGSLEIPDTTYYSAEIFQNVTKIEADPSCVRQPPFPDYSKLTPAPSIRSYRVTMLIYYEPQGPVKVTVRSGKRALEPWQAYASYWLNGGFGLYGRCAEGFRLNHMKGTPQAKPWILDDQVLIDPESAAEQKIRTVSVAFTCRR
jgi:hypothetical protein